MNLELLQSLVELFRAELRCSAQLFNGAWVVIERAEDLMQMVDGRIVASEEEVACALVGIAVHEVGTALRTVAAGAANLLVVAFQCRRQAGVNYGANVGLSIPIPKAIVATTTSSFPA